MKIFYGNKEIYGKVNIKYSYPYEITYSDFIETYNRKLKLTKDVMLQYGEKYVCKNSFLMLFYLKYIPLSFQHLKSSIRFSTTINNYTYGFVANFEEFLKSENYIEVGKKKYTPIKIVEITKFFNPQEKNIFYTETFHYRYFGLSTKDFNKKFYYTHNVKILDIDKIKNECNDYKQFVAYIIDKNIFNI